MKKWQWVLNLGAMALSVVVYPLLVTSTQAWLLDSEGLPLLWLSTGYLLGLVLVFPAIQMLPTLVLAGGLYGVIQAFLPGGESLSGVVQTLGADLAAALVAGLIVRKVSFVPFISTQLKSSEKSATGSGRLDSLRNTVPLLVLAAPAAAMIVTLIQLLPGKPEFSWQAGLTWAMAVLLGMWLLPLLIVAAGKRIQFRQLPAWRWTHWVELGCVGLITLLLAHLVLDYQTTGLLRSQNLSYLFFPVFIWTALRFSPVAVAALSLLLAIRIVAGLPERWLIPASAQLATPADLEMLGQQIYLVIQTGAVLVLSYVANDRLKGVVRYQQSEQVASWFRVRLSALQEVTNLLSLCQYPDVLFRRAIELGRERLEFDRLGIWLTNADCSQLLGTYGVGENGELRSENGRVLLVAETSLIGKLLSGYSDCLVDHDTLLMNDQAQVIGHGSLAVARMECAGRTIGLVCMDNLLNEKPITPAVEELLVMFANSIGHLLHRLNVVEELRTARERLTITLSAARVGLWEYTIAEDRYVYDDYWLALCGVAREQIQANHSARLELIDPRDRSMVQQVWGQACQGQQNQFEVEYRLYNRTIGPAQWLLDRGQVIETRYDGTPVRLAGVSLNITRRKQAEQELQRSQQDLKSLIEYAPVGIIHFEMSGAVTDCNQRTETILKLDRNQLVGKNLAETLNNMAIRASLQTALVGKTSVFEGELATQPGHSVTVRATFGPIANEQGQVWGAIGVLEDISGRKQAEQDRRRLERQMAHTQKMESLGMLAGGIAHDFNNLLVGILGNIGLARAELAPESPARTMLERIENGAQRAADLARQMLTYSGKGQASVESLNLSRLVCEMEHLLTAAISPNTALELNCPNDLPTVVVDASQVRQVVMNLVINASEAITTSRPGRVVVRTGVTRVDSHYLQEAWVDDDLPAGEYVYVEVCDNGRGMDPATRSRLFDPFFSTKSKGRGLGLAAVLGITRSHRGCIKVYSELGHGTTIKLLFPANEKEVSADLEKNTFRAAPESDNGNHPGKILVVDDEPTVRDVCQTILTKRGFEVLLAEDGQQALDLVATEKDHLLLVLLDMTMPVMSGKEVFLTMRRTAPSVPVILSSGYNEQEATAGLRGRGMAGFIQKPYHADELLSKIQAVLGKGSEQDVSA